ncbi:hypothetical protein MPOCJGCO_4889 [Methylobacterium trifolii]|uniref:Uncharacterized protein n=1 Tax=Methylobacterium trifolii TaxID=1003092 RepID=A0ABQ4U8L6_9HYPH|nr:hypothetical protein MPOCJGCO_4889 [Methylobacterium trifolii]
MLAAVAEQNERELAIEGQHVADEFALVVLGLSRQRMAPGQAPFAQEQDRSDRDRMLPEERAEHVVDAPGCARHVEHRVGLDAGGPGVKRPAQCGRARERDPAFGIGHEQAPEHLELVGHPGVHDRVVDVADDDEATCRGRDEHVSLCAHRRVGIERQVDRVPGDRAGRHVARPQVNPEVTVPVGRHARLRTAEAGGHEGPDDFAAADTARDVAQVRTKVVRTGVAIRVRLPKHASDQEDLFARAVAPVGFDDDAAPALRSLGRSGDKRQEPDRRASPPGLGRLRICHPRASQS